MCYLEWIPKLIRGQLLSHTSLMAFGCGSNGLERWVKWHFYFWHWQDILTKYLYATLHSSFTNITQPTSGNAICVAKGHSDDDSHCSLWIVHWLDHWWLFTWYWARHDLSLTYDWRLVDKVRLKTNYGVYNSLTKLTDQYFVFLPGCLHWLPLSRRSSWMKGSSFGRDSTGQQEESRGVSSKSESLVQCASKNTIINRYFLNSIVIYLSF